MAETITTDGAVGEPAPVMPADLSMVVLSVGDMPTLRGYYRALGWQEQPGASDALAIFQLGGAPSPQRPATGDGAEQRGDTGSFGGDPGRQARHP